MARRHGRRRKRRPRARTKVDKSQNRRIKRLENATETKFNYHTFSDTLSSQLAANVDQIYPLLPDMVQGDQPTEMQGNQISLKSVNVKLAIHTSSHGNNSVRVIFFWRRVPVTYVNSAASPGHPPAATTLQPNWDSLINDFMLTPTASETQFNMISPRQLLTVSNKSPLIFLSDRVYQIKPNNQVGVTGNGTPSSGVKYLTFSKSYKDMKLTFNNSNTTSGGPVNRQLFVAIVPTRNLQDVEDLVHVDICSTIRYSDA